ncbi:MAG TPA: site-2 protease family protein [Polyangiaceae bacterium]|jgi:membrane-associated protease RseP (regulator of RpoE activity)|nr:MAG: Peptidase family M50 [Deltaproteobacteria bacterium ADurb.Bin207]HNS95456.1 site-2 protease family protein [Polyangiaceae bacterium]HNZ20604.1 site-2 protease family protein [Polyangiaceae bacterium]HOD20780.1 site-2 protease family protein [Polyangiaceae bacterium]HOE47200.1 site-2 protease family protein [Polyangiaceae bacterium]
MSTPHFPPPAPDVQRSVFEGASPEPVSGVPPEPPRRNRYAIHLGLFVATVISVLFAGNQELLLGDEPLTLANLWKGWTFAVPLMVILLAHEFGHYIAARWHRVHASLPYFIPMPISPFGTMGAIISMKGRIGSRKALLDIGASGPLAGMVFAVPILVWGLLHSEVKEITGSGLLEGQCLLYSLLKRLTVGPIPEGSDVFLHPTAFAGWVGLLITMINLVPVGQLDGGHVAYALIGPRQNAIARMVHYGLLAVFAVNFGYHFLRHFQTEPLGQTVGRAAEMSMFWLVWFGFLFLLRALSGGNHPPTEPGELSRGRKAIAIGTLLLFVLLFMPTPLSQY